LPERGTIFTLPLPPPPGSPPPPLMFRYVGFGTKLKNKKFRQISNSENIKTFKDVTKYYGCVVQ
jgi:hypothetical protein